ncbi:unnamed protein product [Mycena citricolor]|uniref:GH18 domain-containing protein n=1 Tax=Mycena citricolor TaxID=2018698 RepID=A0AAD2GUJ0_9AGAR|nr:unnamed protein product [Mycena citricolor]
MRIKPHSLLAFLPLISVASVQAATCTNPVAGAGSLSSPFWMGTASLHAHGKSTYNPGFKVYRNVKDYGAVGDGVADDTVAINKAISDGGACGQGCPSSSVKPVLVYFPTGTYKVTAPIIPFYFTSLVGDYNNRPKLVAASNFVGVAVIDGDPYVPGVSNPDGSGVNWWTNQNNFFRSVRNFQIDVTAVPPNLYGTAIHWQVGQATSLINIDMKMSTAAGNLHQGVFMENGSGGFMSDLTLDGGNFGLWVSNQQFTVRNVKITRANSAVYQLWNWGFTWQNIVIASCQVGFDIHTGGTTLADQSAGGVLIVDSSVAATGIAVRLSSSQPKSLAGSVVLDNVAFSAISKATVQDQSGVLVAGQSGIYIIDQWFQGNMYFGLGQSAAHLYNQGTNSLAQSTRPSTLLSTSSNFWFTRSRPQYNTYLASQFVSVIADGGAAGDGKTDDAPKINAFIAKASLALSFSDARKSSVSHLFSSRSSISYAPQVFDAGTYLVKSTINIPPGTLIVGEMFSVIMAGGSAFASQASPTPVLRVGNPGDQGTVEISDIVITTQGGSAGAVGIEWNIAQGSQGSAGLWDVHIRLGGTTGTNVQVSQCPTSQYNLVSCATAFLGLHVTPTGSGYFENLWVWNADHDLDDPNQTRINAFSGRGILVESAAGPVWLWGTASEHHVIYEYAFYNTENVFAGLIQTESPYYQPTPNPPAPFATTLQYGDPPGTRADALGLVVTSSYNVFIYGAGLYSFFQTYDQACVPNRNCQKDMALIDQASASIHIYQLTTTGTVNMLTHTPDIPVILGSDNINGYASTATYWRAGSNVVPPPYQGSIPAKDCTSPPKVVGYYIGTAAGRSCMPWAPDATDSSTYTASAHIIYGFFPVAADGSVSITADQKTGFATAQNMKNQEPNIKIMIGIGGWGFGADASGFISMAQGPGTQSFFASSAAALANSVAADGIDIEWPMCKGTSCVTAAQFASIVANTKAAVGRSLIVSVHLPNDFFDLTGLGTAMGSIASYVDFITLITTYQWAKAGQIGDANNLNTIPSNMQKVISANSKIPPSLFLFGIPFFSRAITASNPPLQSSCLSKTDLGQGTFPYYGFDSVANGYIYDENAFQQYDVAPSNYLQSLIMSDGSVFFADSTWTVAQRAASANSLCMGGVAAFSVDQDNIASDLTNGIYSLGGYLPTADAVVNSVGVGNSIDANGYLSSGAYDTFASNVQSQYPFLTAQDSYRVLLLGALSIQSQLSNQLSTFLAAPELTADNFTIYKRWTGKAINFEIASQTGAGNSYWSCSPFTGPQGSCPGYINLNETPINPSPHLTGFPQIQWTLNDKPGFKSYLNSSLGLNLDTLVAGGSFDVSRLSDSCTHGIPPPCKGCSVVGGLAKGVEGANVTALHQNKSMSSLVSSAAVSSSAVRTVSSSAHPSASVLPTTNSTALNVTSRELVDLSKRASYDPLNVDANCHTTWNGLYLIDPDTFFHNPKDIINAYIASTASSVSGYSNLALDPTTESISLMSLLQSTLTAISVGNQSITSTLSYINQTRQDIQEQAQFEAESRRSVLSIVESILMVVLAFIPGVGEILDFVGGGVEFLTAITDIIDLASLTKNLGTDIRALSWVGRLGDEASVARAMSGVENAITDASRFGRFRFGQSVSKVESKLLQCAESNMEGLIMDTVDLGSNLATLGAPAARRRSYNKPSIRELQERVFNDTAPVQNLTSSVFEPILDPRHWEELESRAASPPCLFNVKKSGQLKISSTAYRALCVAGNANMEFPDSWSIPTSTKTVNYVTCQASAPRKGLCQCDHLFEASEFQTAMTSSLSAAERADLCALTSVFGSSSGAIKNIINDKSNFCGLWGDTAPGAKFNPNSIKSNLLMSYGTETAFQDAYTKYNTEGRNLMYSVANDHIQRFKDDRAKIGDNIDTQLHAWHAQVQSSGSASQKTAWAKLYSPNADGTKKSTFQAAAQANTARSQAMLTRMEKLANPTKPSASDPNSLTSSSDTDAKKQGKPPKSGAGDGSSSGSSSACGTNSGKSNKRKRGQ